MKKIILLLFLCLGISFGLSAQTYLTENFDASIPATWTIDDAGGATGDSWISGQQGGANNLDGSNVAIVDSDANGNGVLLLETLTSPAFDTTGATSIFLDFDQFYNNGGGDSAVVEVWDGAAWNAVLTQTADVGGFGAPDQQHINITAYSNAAMQVRFVYNDADIWAWYWLIDNVQVYNATCANPDNLTFVSATDTTVNLSWTAGGTETDWEVAIQPQGTGAPTGAGTATSTNPYTGMGLTPATDYEAYVRADCGGDFSIWIGPINFTTECVTFTAPYTEDFENAGAIPVCWSMSGGEDWLFNNAGPNHVGNNGTLTGSTTSGNFYAVVDASGTDAPAVLTSPLVDISGLTTPSLTFYEISDNEGNANSTLDVEVWDGAAWNNVGTYDTNTSGWELKTIDLSALTITGDVQARFTFSEIITPGDFYDDIAIDDVTFDELPSCSNPSALTFVSATATTADLSWTAGGSETAWEIVVQPAGTGAPTGAGTAITNNPYTATGLTPVTDYEAYVRANCGTEFSIWLGPVNFTTECAPYTPDYIENFTTIPAACWDEADSGDATTGPGDIGAGSWNQDGFLNNGFDGAYSINLWLAAKSDWLLSPQFDLTGGPFQAEFDLGVMQFGSSTNPGTLGSDDIVQFLISTDNGATWTILETWDSTSVFPATGIHPVYDLTAYAGQIVQFGILGSEGTVDDAADNEAFIDNFRVRGIPTCAEPTDLASTNITLTSTEVSWTENGTSTVWNIEYGPTGFAQGTGTTVAGVTNPYIITGLTDNTSYDFYVQAECDPTNLSSFFGPHTFLTGYCESVPTSNDGDGVTNVTINTIAFPSLGDVTYEDQTSPVINVFQGVQANVLIDFATGFTYDTNIWIDFNDDLVFDATELVFQGESTNANPTTLDASFVVPITAPLGQHRMRIGTADSGQATPNPCYGGAFGVTLDFTVDIQQLTCDLPAANYTLVNDCDNSQIFIDVEVTDLGTATSLEISNSFNGDTIQVTALGTTQIGPFPIGQNVTAIVTNEQNTNCVISSPVFNLPACPPVNDECSAATQLTASADETCNNTSATLFGATGSTQTNDCAGTANDDVWFEFTAVSETHMVILSNVTGVVVQGLYEGTDCNSLTNLSCEAGDNNTVSGLTIGNTYYVRVFTNGSDDFQNVTFDICIITVPPPITTSITQYTVTELVEDVLVNSPCSSISNVTSSTGIDFGSDNGIGYFEANGSNFPFESGIVMTTGNANNASGPESGTLSDGGFNWPGDADLEAEIGLANTNNASIIEFDFVPFQQDMSFEFIFAAEEYGTFQCGFSDAFAFLLTDTVTNITTNIALVPGTNIPVSVFSIRDMANLPGGPCGSSFPEFFDFYSDVDDFPIGIGENPLLSPIDFRGRTVPLTAMATVVPNRTYHIKLVVADDQDTAFDSAVFLKAGSFEIGEADLGEDILLSGGNANCEGDEVILDIGVPVGPNATITWYTLNNGIQEPILDENGIPESGTTLAVTQTNNYIVEIVLNANASCFVIDDVLVEFFPNPVIPNTLPDVLGCDVDNTGVAFFDLTENDALIIGTQTDLVISYYLTQQDAMDGMNPIANPTAYQTAPITIYYSAENGTTGCAKVGTFNLSLAPKPILVQADDILGCDDDEDGIANYDLTLNESTIVNNQTGFIFSYYNNLTDAETSMNAIANPSDFDGGVQTVFVRVEDAVNGCFETTTFELTFGIAPMTSFDPNIIYEVCPNATVPIIVTATADNYMESNVTITWYNEGVLVPGQTDLSIDNVLTAGTY
uniref:choice-of-anchor L domain-containing protein n=1 Tax=uncultured Lacinutrix sp. TaxID=574032 RepID=UPI00261360E4